jgi:amino acid transporter
VVFALIACLLSASSIGLLAREMPAAGSLATYAGMTGVIAGSVYTILAFGGFEGAAPLAEESRNPRRTVQKAVLFSTQRQRGREHRQPDLLRDGPHPVNAFAMTGTGIVIVLVAICILMNAACIG